MVDRYPNVDAQLTFTNVTNGVIEYLVDRCGADRVMFGTDTPMRDPRPQVGWLVFTRLSEPQKRLVFGENFRRLLERVTWEGV
jgi:predicted TIM-barrel fold metal-dependent hydrolase